MDPAGSTPVAARALPGVRADGGLGGALARGAAAMVSARKRPRPDQQAAATPGGDPATEAAETVERTPGLVNCYSEVNLVRRRAR